MKLEIKQEEKTMFKFTALSRQGLPVISTQSTIDSFSNMVVDILVENGEKVSYSYLKSCISDATKGKKTKYRGFTNLLPTHYSELGFTIISENNSTYITL